MTFLPTSNTWMNHQSVVGGGKAIKGPQASVLHVDKLDNETTFILLGTPCSILLPSPVGIRRWIVYPVNSWIARASPAEEVHTITNICCRRKKVWVSTTTENCDSHYDRWFSWEKNVSLCSVTGQSCSRNFWDRIWSFTGCPLEWILYHFEWLRSS